MFITHHQIALVRSILSSGVLEDASPCPIALSNAHAALVRAEGTGHDATPNPLRVDLAKSCLHWQWISHFSVF